MKISIYLAGSIQKGHEINESEWTEMHRSFLRKALDPIEVQFFNPAYREDDLNDQKSVFGRDMTQVYMADITFADVRHRRGLGVGAEMMWAKANKKAVLTWAPEGTHYRKGKTTLLGKDVKNYIHPFVDNLSDAIVSDLEEAALWIKEFCEKKHPIKDLSFVKETMSYYQETQLPKDQPMLELLKKI